MMSLLFLFSTCIIVINQMSSHVLFPLTWLCWQLLINMAGRSNVMRENDGAIALWLAAAQAHGAWGVCL
jgi:hypothetical protein